MNFYTNVEIRGNKILLRGYENGQRIKRDIPYQPFLFRNTARKNTGFTALDGSPVEKVDFESIYEMKDYIDQYTGVDNVKLYGMTRTNSLVYPFINEYYPGQVEYDASLMNIAYLDIEVASDGGFPYADKAEKPITAITIKVNDTYYVLGCGDYEPHLPNIQYTKCKDERDLCQRFITLWNSPLVDPDIVTGWNIESFDIPYLVNRITNVMNDEGKLARRMSPWGVIDERTFVFKGKESTVKMLKGVAILDYLALYRKFTYSDVESYALNHIAHIELGEKKVDYSEYESLMELYRSDFQKFIVYNIHDVTLVNRLDEKMKLLDQVFAIAYDAKVNFVDALTTVRMWDMIIHNHLLDKNIVVPLAPTGETLVEKDEPIQGAYVKDPKPGMYKWVVSFDLTSLYPSLIMQYNISPETKVRKIDLTPEDCLESTDRYQEGFETAKQHSYALCANGTMYRKDVKGFLPELMEKVFADRKKYKKLMLEAKALYEKTGDFEHEKKYVQYNNMQMAKKIQLNSCYGALSNVWFRFFDTDLAEAITLSGQVSIRWMQDRINKFMNKSLQTTDIDYVIAVDTDSLYITLDKFVEKVYNGKLPDRDKIIKMVDKACEEVFQPYIEKHYDDLGEHMLVYSQRMQMKRESIADKGIWVAKKRYILNVFNEEGVQYEKPKLKMKGIEAVKSSTPAVVKTAIKEALYILMNGSKDEFYQYVDSFKERFDEMPFEDVASPRSCQGVSKHKLGGKSIPIHVRGALVYNHNINKFNITNTYTPIQDGDKIKFSYLRIPNPLSTNVISAPGALPKQFNIDRYVDHDTQFSKTFTEPVNGIINNIGWSIGKQQTLEDLFG